MTFARFRLNSRKISTEFRLKTPNFRLNFGCFCCFICKYLIFNKKKFNIFVKITLKSVAQFKKKPYICINKIKQY